jgi:hypothetical protein
MAVTSVLSRCNVVVLATSRDEGGGLLLIILLMIISIASINNLHLFTTVSTMRINAVFCLVCGSESEVIA